jgi:hypothetical protein
MKYLILVVLFSGCTVQLKDERVDAVAVSQVLNDHTASINAVIGYIKDLQETKILPIPKQEEDVKKVK